MVGGVEGLDSSFQCRLTVSYCVSHSAFYNHQFHVFLLEVEELNPAAMPDHKYQIDPCGNLHIYDRRAGTPTRTDPSFAPAAMLCFRWRAV